MLPSPGHAADDASPWDRGLHSAVRLIAGAPSNKTDGLRAGIEIRLDPGWKTYWRYPGDSGVPPRFDFSRSDNLERADVLWPAPASLPEADGIAIGYLDDLILPLRIVRRAPDRPTVLRLAIDYAVCEKLCVPVEGQAELALPVAFSIHEAALNRGEGRVPRPTKLASGEPLAIVAVAREAATPHPRIIVDVTAPDGADIALYAEGPTADWALPLPRPVPSPSPGLRRFAFDVDGVPPGVDPAGALLKLTLVAPDQAIEVETRIE